MLFIKSNIKILSIILLLWVFISCNVSERREYNSTLEIEKVAIPANWKRIDACNIQFYILPDLKEKPRQMMLSKDECVKFYGNENIWLVFVFTNDINQSNSTGNKRFSQELDFQFEKTNIGERQAEITTFTRTDMQNEGEGKNYVAVLDIPQTRQNMGNVAMWAYSKSLEDRENVIKIFKSIRF